MAVQVKSIKRKANITVITLTHENNIQDPQKINCIYALNCGYNEVLRSVPIEQFEQLRNQYNTLLSELIELTK